MISFAIQNENDLERAQSFDSSKPFKYPTTGSPHVNPNFGYIQVDWSGSEMAIYLMTRSAAGKRVLSHAIPLRSLL